MPAPELTHASSKYGAQMGRPNRKKKDADLPVTLYLHKLKVRDNDYDTGGAYWGFGIGSEPIYRAVSEDREVELFYRAANRDTAKSMVLEDYPKANFYGGGAL